jgi:hypothetical protein
VGWVGLWFQERLSPNKSKAKICWKYNSKVKLNIVESTTLESYLADSTCYEIFDQNNFLISVQLLTDAFRVATFFLH